MKWIEQCGHRSVLELIVESRDMRDVLTYFKAERNLEFGKMISFVTSDSFSFEKKTGFPLIAEEG